MPAPVDPLTVSPSDQYRVGHYWLSDAASLLAKAAEALKGTDPGRNMDRQLDALRERIDRLEALMIAERGPYLVAAGVDGPAFVVSAADFPF